MDARAPAHPVPGRGVDPRRPRVGWAAVALTGLFSVLLSAPVSAAVVNASAAQTPATVRPGQRDAPLFQLTLSNTNPVLADTLTALTFTNLGAGAGTQTELDLELGTLKLRLDDGDGVFEPAQDASVGTASASGGQVRFTGL